jgi:exodeoxyribonuclease VII large subunit
MADPPEWIEGGVFSVSELVAQLREMLFAGFGEIWVEGEIGSLHRSRAGHVYFDLKDSEAQLRAVLFRRSAASLAFEPEEGMRVRAHARMDLYAERGLLQLVVEDLKPCGEGELRRAFERMKARLLAEGLFDPLHKKVLPFLPRRIGLVTSFEGAAIQDFLTGVRKRFPAVEVLACDARVQGDDAWREIVRGLHMLDAHPEVDVIVVTRGGGSIEDLWNFNREELVRAVFELDTPVVSAIGHEVDLVLCDLVADARAATPTTAAELVVPDAAGLRNQLEDLHRRLTQRQRERLQTLAHRLDAVRRGLVHPAQRLSELRRRLATAGDRLVMAAKSARDRRSGHLETLSGRLDALSPLAVLGRGYSITRRGNDGAILKSSDQVRARDPIEVRLSRGKLRASVTSTIPPDAAEV